VSGRPAILKVDIVADAKGVGPGVSDAESRFGKLGSAASKVGKAVGLGLAAAGVAAVGFGVASVKAASAVEQSTGAIESIYGKAAGAVKRYADSAANDLGLAKSEYQDLAAVVGAQLTNMGQSQREAAQSSRDLIGTGADLAATFGGSVSDAVSAVSSLLKGERDPIERYGVSIKQADIDARLAAQGLEGLTGKALAQAQANATLSLLTDQTAKSHGAFAREPDTLAGKQERLRAQFENVKATVGSALLPMLVSLFGWVQDKLIPGATRFADQLSANLGPSIRQVGGFITNTLVPAARQVYEWFVDKIAPGIRATVTPILNGLRSAWSSVSGSIDDNREGLAKIGNALRVFAEFMADKVAPVVGKVVGGAFRAWGDIMGAQITVIASVADAIGSIITKIRELASAVRNNPIGNLVGKLNPFDAHTVAMTPGSFATPSVVSRPLDGLARSSFSQAASSSSGFTTWGSTSTGTTVIDRRTIDARVFVDGDVVDAPGFLENLERAQLDQVVRLGKATAFGKG
jgi:hypothetical protein